MTAAAASVSRSLLAAFVVWLGHFLACWVAVELWPGEWRANAVAWLATAVALLVMAVQSRHLGRTAERGEVSRFSRRLGRGATAIATVAVLFTALPSVLLLRG